jgi:hypothetical protein
LFGELENRGINPAEFDQWLREGIDFQLIVFQLDQPRKDQLSKYANQLLDEQNKETKLTAYDQSELQSNGELD